jgi:hypothetical protein
MTPSVALFLVGVTFLLVLIVLFEYEKRDDRAKEENIQSNNYTLKISSNAVQTYYDGLEPLLKQRMFKLLIGHQCHSGYCCDFDDSLRHETMDTLALRNFLIRNKFDVFSIEHYTFSVINIETRKERTFYTKELRP